MKVGRSPRVGGERLSRTECDGGRARRGWRSTTPCSGSKKGVRLVIDGVGVITYSTFPAGKIRYESDAGPVTLGDRTHTAEVRRVQLTVLGQGYHVLDTYSWEFTTN